MTNHENYIKNLREKVQYSGWQICFCAFPKPKPGTVCGTASPNGGGAFSAKKCEHCNGIIVQTVR